MTTSGSNYNVGVDNVTEPEWSELLARFDDASLYQTWAYGAVSWGERQLSHLILKRGQEVVAAAQLRVVQIPVLRRGVAYLRWGPLWRRRGATPDPRVLSSIAQAVVQEYAGRRGLLLRLVPNTFREDIVADQVVQAWTECG